MRDRFFFPAALVVVGLMVFFAIRPAIGALPTGTLTGDGSNYDKIVVEGDYLHKIYAGGNAKTELATEPDGKRVLLIEADAGALRDEPELGPHFRLAADLEIQFAGQTIRTTVRARPVRDQGAMQIALNYSAGRVGESGWKIFDLKPEFEDFSFDYDVPLIEGDQGVDYFGIRPVVPDKSRALLVERVTFERLGSWKTGDPS
ncbi:MAG: hypothetical protein KJ871_07520 [Alphaproteobacteria bacterium]|nr:hypothetical protein [Alphaproteobacteria bacterium]MBU2084925.1 hypothetical protein [Alphaproteobacteria bacterium]MBU2143997.1 hypothetical protein [Alphaproteobacteria bacterium]MBU2198112.1 hypothetical protein [Alphaproteobacteria bacterium]